MDKNWVPAVEGFSLYVRPTAIANNVELGVRAPNKAMFFTVCSPVGPYYPTGFKPIKLFSDNHYVRAFPGGVGGFKVGA